MAYDNPIPGFGTHNTINLRLWSAKPHKEFDLEAFNTGDYVQVRPGGFGARRRAVWCGGVTRASVGDPGQAARRDGDGSAVP